MQGIVFKISKMKLLIGVFFYVFVEIPWVILLPVKSAMSKNLDNLNPWCILANFIICVSGRMNFDSRIMFYFQSKQANEIYEIV